MTFDKQVNAAQARLDLVERLMNEYFELCEVRGELSPADNDRIEFRIAEITAELRHLKWPRMEATPEGVVCHNFEMGAV
jgi:hypothetical protein